MRFPLRAFSFFVLAFLTVAPCARAQFENGCCNRITEVLTTCTNGLCEQHFVQYSCPEYAGPGEPGITVVGGGIVCCSTIYKELFSNGYCEGSATANHPVEQHTRLAYVRTCSGAYELTMVLVPVLSIPAVPKGTSDATASASK